MVAHDQVPPGALDACTGSHRAAGQEISGDVGIAQQAAAEIFGISLSPWSFYNFLKALSIYCIRWLVIFGDTTPVLGKAVMWRKLLITQSFVQSSAGHYATKIPFLSITLLLVFSATYFSSAFALSSPSTPSAIFYLLNRPFSSDVKAMPLSYFSQYSHNNCNLKGH